MAKTHRARPITPVIHKIYVWSDIFDKSEGLIGDNAKNANVGSVAPKTILSTNCPRVTDFPFMSRTITCKIGNRTQLARTYMPSLLGSGIYQATSSGVRAFLLFVCSRDQSLFRRIKNPARFQCTKRDYSAKDRGHRNKYWQSRQCQCCNDRCHTRSRCYAGNTQEGRFVRLAH